MTTSNAIAGRDLETLRTAISGDVFAVSDQGYDKARQAWNLTTDERPAVVVMAESAADVVQAVRFARARGMRIAPQGTGHGSEPLEPLEGAMLLRTVRMRGVRIDPAAGIARAEAGALWQDVTVPAGEHGLAALASGWNSHAPSYSTASGCVAEGAGMRLVISSAARTRPSTRSAPKPSRSGRGSSCVPPAGGPANVPSTR